MKKLNKPEGNIVVFEINKPAIDGMNKGIIVSGNNMFSNIIIKIVNVGILVGFIEPALIR